MEPETFPEEPADALVGVQRLIRRRLRRRMPDPWLRGAEVELLRLVVARSGIGISDAAEDLGLAANSVSALVNQLAKAGYLVREAVPADRRAARLLPTPAAGTRLPEWRRRRAELVRRHVARLDDADRRALHARPSSASSSAGTASWASGRRSPCHCFFGSNALYPVSVMPGWLQPAGPSGPLIFTRGSDVRHAGASAFSACFRITAGHGLITDQKG